MKERKKQKPTENEKEREKSYCQEGEKKPY